MTTRFKREDLTEGITGAIHETGHALYEQARSPAARHWIDSGTHPIPLTACCSMLAPFPITRWLPLPTAVVVCLPCSAFLQGRNLEHDGLPVNQAAGMGVHESQSLLWERMVALGRPFAAYLLPLMRQHFPEVRWGLWRGAAHCAGPCAELAPAGSRPVRQSPAIVTHCSFQLGRALRSCARAVLLAVLSLAPRPPTDSPLCDTLRCSSCQPGRAPRSSTRRSTSSRCPP